MTIVEVEYMEPKKCLRCEGYTNRLIRGYCQCCYPTVKKAGVIQTVPKPDVALTVLQTEFITGSLLGDAWMRKLNKGGDAQFGIERSQKDLKYLEWQYNFVSNLCKQPIVLRDRVSAGRNTTHSCVFRTRCLPSLSSIYDDWYPNGEKIIPSDLKLTKLIMQIWYCDDGCLQVYDSGNGGRMIFATNGFRRDEVAFLRDLIMDRYDEDVLMSKVKSTHTHAAYVLQTNAIATATILKDLQDGFPSGMERKCPQRLLDVINGKVSPNFDRIDWSKLEQNEMGYQAITDFASGNISFELFLDRLQAPIAAYMMPLLNQLGAKEAKRLASRRVREGRNRAPQPRSMR